MRKKMYISPCIKEMSFRYSCAMLAGSQTNWGDGKENKGNLWEDDDEDDNSHMKVERRKSQSLFDEEW